MNELVIPEGTEELDPDAYEYGDFTRIVLPASLIEMPDFLTNTYEIDASRCVQITEIPEFCFFNAYLRLFRCPPNLGSIRESAFEGSSLETFVCRTIEMIDEAAFRNCASLKSVSFRGAAFSLLPEHCFRNCLSLLSVELPATCIVIEEEAFAECARLERVAGGQQPVFAGNMSFSQCGLATLPWREFSHIGEFCFEGCQRLREAVFQSPYLGQAAFANCPALETARLVAEEVGAQCFLACSSLQDVELGEGTLSLFQEAFKDCGRLTRVALPSTLETIDNETFMNCGFAYVQLPPSLAEIGRFAFANCRNLLAASGGEEIQVVREFAFDGCTLLGSDNAAPFVLGVAPEANVEFAALNACINMFYFRYGDNEDFNTQLRTMNLLARTTLKLIMEENSVPVEIAMKIQRMIPAPEAQRIQDYLEDAQDDL